MRRRPYDIALDPGKCSSLRSRYGERERRAACQLAGVGRAAARRRAVVEDLRRDGRGSKRITMQFERWAERARSDLHMLLTETTDGFVPYAGIPWYVAPFGRDSLITALQILPFDPDIASGTLQYLARYQGTQDDAFTDQQPGKIMHEYRRGEMATSARFRSSRTMEGWMRRRSSSCFSPSTCVGRAMSHLVRDVWPAVERALDWMDAAGRCLGYLASVPRRP